MNNIINFQTLLLEHNFKICILLMMNCFDSYLKNLESILISFKYVLTGLQIKVRKF